MMDNDQRVRELAYQIWESEGRPEGQQERHWRMARSLAEAETVNHGEPEASLKQRFEGDEEPEKPAILQPPPRRKGRLPNADPEVPAQAEAETVAPTPEPAARRSPAKARATKSAPTVTPTAKQRQSSPGAAESATPPQPAARKPRTKNQSV